MHQLELYRCVICKAGSLMAVSEESSAPAFARCTEGQAQFPFRHNILDTMIQPSVEAIKELQGMAIEEGMASSDWDTFRVREVDRIWTFDARLEESANQPVENYQQKAMHFHQALNTLGPWKASRALEIGSETDYYYV